MGTRGLRYEVLFLVVFVALFAAMPLQYGFAGRVPDVALKIAIYAIMALGLNVVIGYAGLLDLGYVAFMSTGMLITALAMSVAVVPQDQLTKILADPNGRQYVVDAGAFQIPTGGFTIPTTAEATRPFGFDGSILVAMALAGTVCAAMGVLRGLPTLRLVGDYYAIVTLGFAEILYILYRSVAWTGGAQSLNFAGASCPTLFGARLTSSAPAFYYMVALALALTVFALVAIRESRLGRAFAAIRLDPIAAQTCGIPVGRYKLVAFAVSGFIGGLGGSLFAVFNGNYSATAVNFWESILLVAILVLGGLGSVRGALIGSVVMIGMNELLREELPIPSWPPGTLSWWRPVQHARFLFYGVVLVAMMRFRPAGIWPQRPGGEPWSPARQAQARSENAALFNLARDARP